MWFAQGVPSTEQVIEGFGLPAGIIIISLVAVIIYLARDNKRLQNEKDSIQDLRLSDAKETLAKVTEPLEKQTQLSSQIYEIVVRNNGN